MKSKPMNQKSHQNGFTLVELMVASSVFAVILTISMYGFAMMSKFYQRGLYANRTQQTARDVVSEIGATIQGTGGDIIVGGDKPLAGVNFKVICVDTVRYMYRAEAYNPITGDPTQNIYEKTGKYVTGRESDNVLISDTLSNKYGCESDPVDASTARVLLDQGFRLINFNVVQPGGTIDPIYNISLNLIYSPGDNDGANSDYYYQNASGANNAYAACKGGAGRAYCYSANVGTTVTRRIAI